MTLSGGCAWLKVVEVDSTMKLDDNSYTDKLAYPRTAHTYSITSRFANHMNQQVTATVVFATAK